MQPRNSVQDCHKFPKIQVRVDILFPMRTDQVKLPGGQLQPLKHVGFLDALAVVLEHLEHGAACLDHGVWGYPLA